MNLSINDEYSPLKKIVIGLGTPYQRDKTRVAQEMADFPMVPDTAWKEQVLALAYPTETQLIQEYNDFVSALMKHGVEVLFPNPEAAYSFDYTCPRDIGFVIGDTFFIANMAVASRANEIETVMAHLKNVEAKKIVSVPEGCIVEGGDVILLDNNKVLVGINQRTNREGYEFLKTHLMPRHYELIPVFHNQLHLDCCLNPLGQGHMLIHIDSLAGNSEKTWQVLKQYVWVQVDGVEREHLATNVLSINPTTIVARKGETSVRVNQ
ncbi:MAG: arginine deiminase family protein, partial [Chloroflexota bacterium]